jgi:hypothetical protein
MNKEEQVLKTLSPDFGQLRPNQHNVKQSDNRC